MMAIANINAMGAGISFGGAIEVLSVARRGALVLCDCGTFPIERVFVEFEDRDLAENFELCVKDGTAEIVLDEDLSIDAAPTELREEYELALVSGDKERLEEVLTECMRERQARDAATQIQERTGARVSLVIGKIAGPETDNAKNADVVLFVWIATSHAVFRAFDGFERRRFCYVQGTGAASIVRSLERWTIELRGVMRDV